MIWLGEVIAIFLDYKTKGTFHTKDGDRKYVRRRIIGLKTNREKRNSPITPTAHIAKLTEALAAQVM